MKPLLAVFAALTVFAMQAYERVHAALAWLP
jgi:hypothetical protein